MLRDLTEEQGIQALAQTDLRLACERARDLVASDPQDEAAAALLTTMVRRLAESTPVTARRSRLPEPAVAQAANSIRRGELEQAEILLRQHLKVHRNDPPAMHLMAEIAARCGFREDAERILRQAALLHSSSPDARTDLGQTLHRIACARDYPEYVSDALAALDDAMRLSEDHEEALAYKAAILVQIRSLDDAEASFERLVSAHPLGASHWSNFAYLLKTVGKFGRAVAAYRTAIALDAAHGGAWWGLANLKLVRFFSSDIEAMERALSGSGISADTRVDINFALASAYDKDANYPQAAQCLLAGNALRSERQPWNPDNTSREVDLVSRIFTREFFDHRTAWGDGRADPIFILGMPRSGSTLIEQILASHSLIEGTEELFILLQLAGELSHGEPNRQPDEIFAGLERDGVAALGARYVEMSKRQRLSERPFFTDKNPSNWRYLGIVACALPNAKIIDIRRNPLDCCFANYFQHFLAGADFSYDQTTLARYYSDYVRMMRHFDNVLPGRIHRVIYDDLVENFEPEVRRILDYLGLPFEDECLRFFDTKRPVHTPSSEQVRQPINTAGVGRWRNYEPWLGELKSGLGEVLENWR